MRTVLMLLLTVICAAPISASQIELDVNLHGLGGNNRGFGILAEYPAGSPGRLILTRSIKNFSNEMRPDYGGWVNICSLRIFDPSGKMVKIVDIGQQKKAAETFEVDIPAGVAGIWRFSVANGLSSDSYKIAFPATKIWGIRGEMALGIGHNFPKELFLYVPETSKLLIVESFGGGDGQPQIYFKEQLLGTPEKNGARMLKIIENPPQNEVVNVKLNNMSGKSLAIDGMPGLLCPTPEAAAKLKGNLRKVDGKYAAGPVQEQARKIMNGFKPDDLKINVLLPALPDKLENTQIECLIFSKYGCFNGIQAAAGNQILDSANPFYGANVKQESLAKLSNPQEFLYPGVLSPFDMAGLASAVAFPGKYNLLRGNKALLNRAILAAFYHIANMQGDDILREGDFRTGNYPMTHLFFVYEALANAYLHLKPLLSDDVSKVYAEGLIAIGDKAATFMAYESNQWSHVINAHLTTYLATGEKRFLDYFEIMANAYLDNIFGPNSKYGQHPAGYYLEEYGPDGNYDHLNLYSVVNMYYSYRQLPEAKKKLTGKLKKSIEKDLNFASFYWLEQSDGNLLSPTALNCRTSASLSHIGYPGTSMASREFDMAYSRFMKIRIPPRGPGMEVGTFAHYARNSELGERLIRADYPKGINGNNAAVNFSGAWTMNIYNGFKLPQIAKEAVIPAEAEYGVWELPGQVAWKNGDLYGVVFADVAQANPDQILAGITTGGPQVLWTRANGNMLSSMRNTKLNRVDNLDDVTWSCVTGELNGKVFASGKERNTISWQKKDTKFTITSGPLRAMKNGKLSWEYVIEPNKVVMTVTLNAPELKNPVLNLPFYIADPAKTKFSGPLEGKFAYGFDNDSLKLSYPPELTATLSEPRKCSHLTVRALRIPFPQDGRLSITFNYQK